MYLVWHCKIFIVLFCSWFGVVKFQSGSWVVKFQLGSFACASVDSNFWHFGCIIGRVKFLATL